MLEFLAGIIAVLYVGLETKVDSKTGEIGKTGQRGRNKDVKIC